jgi:ABC-type dipeptide/oligopeptide/nickel transport system ATPase subunit
MEIIVKQIASKGGNKHKYSLEPHDKVSRLRELVATDLGVESSSSIKLIFKGRFLKDESDLEMNGLQDGSVIHVMSSTSNSQAAQAASGVPQVDELEEAGDRDHDSLSASRSTGLQDLMQSLGPGNTELEDMMESNPEMRAMMQDPEQMRTMMNIASNPQLRLEYMRNMDRALSNIESLPGGFNALASMMHDIPQPNVERGESEQRTQEINNPFFRLFSHGHASTVNENPMPNPWQSSGGNEQFPGLPSIPDLGIPGNADELVNSLFSEENMQEFSRAMRDPEMRSRILREVLGEEGSRQISGEMIDSMLTDMNSIRDAMRSGNPNPLAAMQSTRQIDEAEMASKIQILRDMGFPDEHANRRALQISGGDINAAVEALLTMSNLM